MQASRIFLCTLALIAVSAAHAHVTVAPVESRLAAAETYSLRVPSEGGRTTVEVSIAVPEGLTVTSVAVPKGGAGVAYVRKAGEADRIVWTLNLPAGEVAQLAFSATNAAQGMVIGWKIRQTYSNGNVVDWTPSTRLQQ